MANLVEIDFNNATVNVGRAREQLLEILDRKVFKYNHIRTVFVCSCIGRVGTKNDIVHPMFRMLTCLSKEIDMFELSWFSHPTHEQFSEALNEKRSPMQRKHNEVDKLIILDSGLDMELSKRIELSTGGRVIIR